MIPHTPALGSSVAAWFSALRTPRSQRIRSSKSSEDNNNNRRKKKKNPGEGWSSGLLAIGLYALMHDNRISMMTLLLLGFVWWYCLEQAHQRIFLFFLVCLKFAEYFSLLPTALKKYQTEDWWDVPTIKMALITLGVFWSIAWVSAWTGSYLDHREQKRKLLFQQQRQAQLAMLRAAAQ